MHRWQDLHDRLDELYTWAGRPKPSILRVLVPELRAPWQLFGDKRLATPSCETVLSGVRACLLAGGMAAADLDKPVEAWTDAYQQIQRSDATSRHTASVTAQIVAAAFAPIATAVLVNLATEYETNSFIWALVVVASGLSALLAHHLLTRQWMRRSRLITGAVAAVVLVGGAGLIELRRSEPIVPDGPPLTAHVLGVGRESSLQGSDWVFADKLRFTAAQSREIASLEDDDLAMRRRGAIDPLLLPISIMLVGTARNGVTVTDMWLKSRCSRPLTGTLLHRQPGAGPRDTPRLAFDLDRPNPHAQAYGPIGASGTDYFRDTSIFLAHNEQQVVSIEARTLRSSCAFDIVVVYSTGGTPKSLTVDRAGFTLAVTAYADGSISSATLRDTNAYASYYVYSDTGEPRLIPRH
ncbi:hypothetical protein [Nonomuraea fuscirosea]|uniref:hypothetical protein n=1 Tax=Nonomuraea fuscirosea TaxID=1291556 RepID=UPI00340D4FFF